MVEEQNERKIMPKEKRNNLAVYTLAGSILLSSVLVSMNQVNAHTADSKKIKALQIQVNELESSKSDSAIIDALIPCINSNFQQARMDKPFRNFTQC